MLLPNTGSTCNIQGGTNFADERSVDLLHLQFPWNPPTEDVLKAENSGDRFRLKVENLWAEAPVTVLKL